MKLQQYLALTKGTEIRAFRDRKFEVIGRAVVDGIEQPTLIDLETREPLFGAIYVAHLLSFDGRVSREADHEDVAEELPVASSFAAAADRYDPLDDVETYENNPPAYESDQVSVFEITCRLVEQQPSAERYQSWLYEC